MDATACAERAVATLTERALGARSRRCVLLVSAILIMGAADLLLTLTYARTVGMIEVNPLARLMIALGGAHQLVMFKVFCTALSAGVLFLCRRAPVAERASWVCAAAMLALTAHWVNYNATVSSFTNDIALLAANDGACDLWITLAN